MRLEVCLGRYIQSILVAQVIPAWVVRIVAGAHRVDVQLLHYFYILYHTLYAYHIAAVGVHLVAVSALNQHGLSVYQQLCVFYFYIAEAHLYGYHLHHALLVFQAYVCLI